MKLFRQFLSRAFQGCSALLPTIKKIIKIAKFPLLPFEGAGGELKEMIFKDPFNQTILTLCEVSVFQR